MNSCLPVRLILRYLVTGDIIFHVTLKLSNVIAVYGFFCVALCCVMLSSSVAWGDSYCEGTLNRWSDGDTLRVDCRSPARGVTKVRLIGLDTPESIDNIKLRRDLKRRPDLTIAQMIHGGKKAKKFAETLCPPGSAVRVDTDVVALDSYSRVLGYLFCNDTFINAELIRSGYGIPYSVAPNTLLVSDFSAFGHDAAQKKLGLWADRLFQEADIDRKHKNTKSAKK